MVAGYTRGKGRRESSFGSLVLATHGPTTASSTSATSAPASTTRAGAAAEEAPTARAQDLALPAAPKMPRVRKGDVVWVEPKLVAQTSFAEFTHDGRLRAPVYLGLREDKDASEVRGEPPRRSRT